MRISVAAVLFILISGAICAESPLVVTGGLSAQRGFDNLTQKAYVPASWTRSAYDNAWKRWAGVKSKPQNYDRAFREYYGLPAAPFPNGNLPMGMKQTKPLFNRT